MDTNTQKIYFASDFHLGAPTHEKSLERERKICDWLEFIKPTCKELFLVGDVFDFWFEYKQVVPKGFVRFQGKIAAFTDAGIQVHFFTGNHDMWAFDYLPKELGVKLYREPITRTFGNKKFFIGHGDGLGPGDNGYKFLKRIFSNKLCQWIFARIHPNFGVWLANYSSKSSRIKTGISEDSYLGEEKEWLVSYCKEQLEKSQIDYFIFGHRHLPIELPIRNSIYFNLGDWIQYDTYATFDGEKVSLKYWDSEQKIEKDYLFKLTKS
jgi:UDP-2,3-diacylglucosamine hydrolase